MIYSVCYEGESYHGGILEEFDNYELAKKHCQALIDSGYLQRNLNTDLFIQQFSDDDEYIDTLIEYT